MSTLDMIFDGALASSGATLFSNPFDVMLTRMQLQGEMMGRGMYKRVYTGTFQGMYHIAREEGVLALQRGLASAVCWQVAQNGVRIGMYPVVKMEIEHHFGGSSLAVAVVSSALCGVIGAFLASPLMLMKIRLQSQHSVTTAAHLSKSTIGEQYNYKGVIDGLRKTYRNDGICGLWQGVTVASQRTMLGSMTQLTSYDLSKSFTCTKTGWHAGDLRVHLISSFVSAMCVTALMTPLNVVMTRCYSERFGEKSKYSMNVIVSSWRVYKVEGVSGLYKGAVPLFARIAPHTVLTFVFLEQIRKMREKYTNRAYTSGSVVKSTLRFFQSGVKVAKGENVS